MVLLLMALLLILRFILFILFSKKKIGINIKTWINAVIPEKIKESKLAGLKFAITGCSPPNIFDNTA
ncbi:MAG: hypothetical protein ACTSUG_02050 [Candidatus Helarchaeota archaeon]